MLTDTFLDSLARLNYKTAAKYLLVMHPHDLYDFMAETGADPWGKPNARTHDGLIDYAFEHIDKNGPGVLLDWVELTEYEA
jgi:hypothetical protein